jgi:hypothetical protein
MLGCLYGARLKIYCSKYLFLVRNHVFMAASTSQLQDALSKYSSNDLASIIEKLSGDKDNLHVDVQHVKFFVGKQHFEINGTINFRVFHKTSIAEIKTKDA